MRASEKNKGAELWLAGEMERTSAEVSAFYDAASTSDAAEESAWGQLGESELAVVLSLD
jgi:hypothetical protein